MGQELELWESEGRLSAKQRWPEGDFADRLLDRVGMTLLPSGVLTRKESGGHTERPQPFEEKPGPSVSEDQPNAL
jgi:hypothetical protein